MKIAIAMLALSCSGCVPAAAERPSGLPAAGTTTLRLGEQGRLGGLTVRALRIEEDSRCPSSVQCVQAGTVRLAVRLSDGAQSREAVLRGGVAEPIGGGRFLWLVAACPYPARPGPIAPSAYTFVVAAGANLTETPLDHHCGPD